MDLEKLRQDVRATIVRQKDIADKIGIGDYDLVKFLNGQTDNEKIAYKLLGYLNKLPNDYV